MHNNVLPTNECNPDYKIVIILLSNIQLIARFLKPFISAKTDRFLKSNRVEDFARLKE
jgi:hypothetical protein